MEPVGSDVEPARDAALARVLAYRERGRSRSALLRALVALAGGSLLVASIPLVVLLPEIGIPAMLVGLRFLAVEVEWAARAYTWIDWRFTQAHAWFHRQSRLVRVAVLVGLLAVAVALVWLLIHELL